MSFTLIGVLLGMFPVMPWTLQRASAQAAVAFVQSAYAAPQEPSAVVNVPFSLAQSAGNLNVVIVGWNDTAAHMQSVVDTVGNTYQLAAGPTVRAGFATQTIYYAANIAPAAASFNTVTVTFDGPAIFADIRIAEYQGLATTNPVDVVAAGQGNGTSSESGAVVTTHANDLLVAANTVWTGTVNAGAGFTRRAITIPDGDILEDQIVTATGSYSASAPIAPAGNWIMQMVAFRAADAAGDAEPPTNTTPAPTPIAYVQSAYATPQSPSASVSVAFPSAQSSGNLNVVVVGWNDAAASVLSIVDALGNPYQLAIGPTVRDGFGTQSIYYAANIAAAAASGNTVTVTFSQPAVYADIRIAEYQGLATANPVDAVSAGQGNDTSSDSGRAITTSANDLLVGANTVRTRTMDPGAGFTPRAITSPDGDLLEDRIVTAAGSYNTTAPLSSPGDWIMQMVAFRAASADALPPTGVTDKTGVAPPTVVAEARFAVDSPGPARADLSLDVNGANTLLLVALHAEFDGGDTNWSTQDNGVPGALLVNTDGYNGGAGNQRFRIYYWVNPPAGTNAIVVQNSYQGPNELAVSAVLLSNVAPGAPFGAMALDVSSTPRTSESETVATNTGDLVVHVIADALFTRGTLGGGETSVSVANDGGHTAPGDGDASLWISTKPGADAGTTVSSSGWADSPSPSPRVINGVAIVVHGSGAVVDTPTPVTDVQPPSAPGTLAATVLGGTQIGLSWGPATDNAGVTAYVIQRCQGAGCMNFATLAASTTTRFSDTGLTPGTTYAYVVFAKDAANNVGPTSNVASAMTALIDPTLVAAFAFDEGSGLTVIDASGHGNTGTIANATWTSGGKYGNALSFDGTSSRVTIDDAASLRLTTGMTLEAWVNPSTASSRWRDIIYRGADSFYLDTYNSAPVAGLTLTPSTNSNTFGFAALPLNTWTHLAETFDGSNVTLFVNGVQVATTPIAGSLLDSTDPLEIGSDHIFGQYFRGLIDEVRVYNVALTADQIQTDMVTPVGTAAP